MYHANEQMNANRSAGMALGGGLPIPTVRDKPEVSVCLERLMSLVSDLQGSYSMLADRIGPVLMPAPPESVGEGKAGGMGSEVGHRIAAACEHLEQLHRRIHADTQRVAV